MADGERDRIVMSVKGPTLQDGLRVPWVGILASLLIFGFLILLLLPAVGSGPASPRAQCGNNLKQIGLSLEIYHDTYGAFPPAYTVDADGRRLHSWRALILPFGDGGLHRKVDYSQPWDAPANAAARRMIPFFFHCPAADVPENHTTYLALVGEGAVFRGSNSARLADITDRARETALIIEVPTDRAVDWMAPEDADEALFLSLGSNSKLPHPSGFNVLMADGSVRFLKADTPADVRKALFTCAGGDNDAIPKDER